MSDFDIKLTGASVVAWTDSATPSRLNPRSGNTMLRYRAYAGQTVTVIATLGIFDAPVDSELGGRLFFTTSWEQPTPYPVSFTSTAGQSSQQSFVPVVGHYLIGMRRTGGGSVFIHIDVEAAP